MLKLRKVSRITTITLLILLVSLPIAAFQVPNVSAHEELHVHPYMCEEAAKLLPEGSAMRDEIFSYMGHATDVGDPGDPIVYGWGIKFGAYNEDHYDYVYPELTKQNSLYVTNTHFWNADAGQDAWVKAIDAGIAQIGDQVPNAYRKADSLFLMALNTYEEAEEAPHLRSEAYEYLGHVAHLMMDMTLPAHVHVDFHPHWPSASFPLLPGGDDSFEDWFYESGAYQNYGAGSVVGEKLITFPDDIQAYTRRTYLNVNHGVWEWGLYYLMYTTNQVADYFASDDEPGDTFDPEGWMDYSTPDWPGSPRTLAQIEDNDDIMVAGVSLGDAFSNDNDEDGDLSRIASKTVPYGLRAVATLYKMFYELTHPPTADISIDYADHDGDTNADFRNVHLDLTYDVGADLYFRDLEAWYGNEPPDLRTQQWQGIGAVPGHHGIPWVLSEGDGPKTVYYQVRNLMGVCSELASADVYLEEKGMPQLFDFTFSANGTVDKNAYVDFYLEHIYKKQSSGDGDLEFYLKWHVDDGTESGRLIQTTVEPWYGGYYKIGPNWGYGANVLPLIALTDDMEGCRLGYGRVLTHPDPWDASYLGSCRVNPGGTVRLRTHGYDYDDWPNPDDDLGNVWTGTYQVPTTDGTTTLAWGQFDQTSTGDTNEYYKIQVRIVARVGGTSCHGVEWDKTHDEPYHGAVWYEGTLEERKQYIRSPDDLPSPPYYEWFAHIDPPNPAVGYEMRGPELWAWTVDPYPDMVIIGFSPVYLLVTDPFGNKVGTRRAWSVDEKTGRFSPRLETFDQIPGASVSYFEVDGDGVPDTVVVFNDRTIGEYQIQVTSSSPPGETSPTYSIGVNTYGWPKDYSAHAPFPPPPRQFEFLVKNAEGLGDYGLAQYEVRSDYWGMRLPPIADANGPYMASEGAAVNFNASGSTDPDGDSLTYRWDFENDGTWDTAWSGDPTATHTWQDDWTGSARVQVSDGTFTDIAMAAVTIFNVLPTANAGPKQLAASSEEVQFSGSFTDPGVLDTHTVEWDFGDGTTATGTLTPTHVYSGARKYTVTLTVTDDDGGVGVDTLTVNTGVEVSIAPLAALVPPGDSTTYNVLVHHLGTTEDTYDLELAGLDPTWYSFSSTSVALSPDQSESVTLTVSPPYAALVKTYGFTVVATSQTDPTVFGTADADALIATAHDLGLEEIPPVTNLFIGQPQYVDPVSSKIFVTSSTPFTLTAEDNPGGFGVASTFYHILNATHDTGKLKYTTPFYLAGLSDGQYSIVYYSKDNVANKEDAKSETVILDNAPPTTTTVVNPVSINVPVTLLATVDDSSTGGCRIASAQYSVDGGDWISMNAVDGDFDEVTEEVTATLSPIPTPDVLTITLRGTDAVGNGYQLSTLLAVYDPAAGFVTGGGWINSPLGAYSADPTLTGKATFAFVSRYQKGATIPTGRTEFQFHAGDLHFQSSTYEWLVVAGSRAQFKGSGTINGAGNYGFMLTAIDGQINGGDGVDKFRIKIWDKATGIIIYDNQMDTADTDNPKTAIAAGNILIHTK